MNKKTRIKKWELVYSTLLWFVMGLWIGYLIGGSSSWIAKPDWREIITIDVPVYICIAAFLFLVIGNVIDYYRAKRFKELRNKLRKNVE